METSKTDKNVLAKGIKILIFAILSLFTGPILLSIAFSNKEKPLYLPILILGCLVSALAIFLIFKGINIIMNSMFKK
ncbi:DUF6095 family protein [Confluentibacter citreus]|uniref:DUF6095 family protein n=1 Tax=Confluentibacter citreus TaxID=2007307 RepID=UPI000C293B06|nr:DUF6095 family protein [Confluentibacter citreus]